MIIRLDPTGTVKQFQAIVEEMSQNDDIKSLMVLACDENGFSPGNIDDVLKTIKVPVFGGIFPGIIHGTEKMEKGTIVAGLSIKPDIHVVPGLSDISINYGEVVTNLFPEATTSKTMLVFVDGYSQRISALIDSLYNVLGLSYNFIGGGAGSINPSALDMQNTPCLLTNNGLIKDSAILALVNIESGVGVGHGWQKIDGPYKVTESDGNAIKSLDWKPAFDMYREIIKSHSGEAITKDNFFDIAKSFPFGISRVGSETIVRDPFTVDGDTIVVATPIPQESFVDILTGDHDSLVDAARQSYTSAKQSIPAGKKTTTLLIDCISRALFLEDNFSLEIEAVRRDDEQLIGVLTLGEIASSGMDFMEFFNKTCVVGILGD